MKHGRFVNFYTSKSDPFFDSIQTSAKYYLARKRAFVSLFSRIFHAFNPQKHRFFGSKHSDYPLIAMLSPHKSSPLTMPKFTLHVSGYTFWFTLQYFQSVSDLLYTYRFLLLNHFTVILFDNCSNDTAFCPKVNDFVSFFKV